MLKKLMEKSVYNNKFAERIGTGHCSVPAGREGKDNLVLVSFIGCVVVNILGSQPIGYKFEAPPRWR